MDKCEAPNPASRSCILKKIFGSWLTHVNVRLKNTTKSKKTFMRLHSANRTREYTGQEI